MQDIQLLIRRLIQAEIRNTLREEVRHQTTQAMDKMNIRELIAKEIGGLV